MVNLVYAVRVVGRLHPTCFLCSTGLQFKSWTRGSGQAENMTWMDTKVTSLSVSTGVFVAQKSSEYTTHSGAIVCLRTRVYGYL